MQEQKTQHEIFRNPRASVEQVLIPVFQNQYPVILLPPLSQFPGQDQQNRKQT